MQSLKLFTILIERLEEMAIKMIRRLQMKFFTANP